MAADVLPRVFWGRFIDFETPVRHVRMFERVLRLAEMAPSAVPEPSSGDFEKLVEVLTSIRDAGGGFDHKLHDRLYDILTAQTVEGGCAVRQMWLPGLPQFDPNDDEVPRILSEVCVDIACKNTYDKPWRFQFADCLYFPATKDRASHCDCYVLDLKEIPWWVWALIGVLAWTSFGLGLRYAIKAIPAAARVAL